MKSVYGRTICVAGFVAGVAACKPSVGQPPYRITDSTLLAVYGSPSEVKPNASVTYSFLIGSPAGTVTDVSAFWDVCETPKPPSESNAVASACAQPPDAGASSVGQTFTVAMPSKACQLFGPIAPTPAPGQPAVRPRDPDSTGGYYLPVQVWLPDLPSGPAEGFAFERISCNLANAPASAITDYNSRYQPNISPGIDHTDIVDASGRTPFESVDGMVQTVSVISGASVVIEAALMPGSAETFAYYDATTETVVDQQESLHMSWFVTGGTFEHDRTGVAAGDSSTSTNNRWTAPSLPGTVNLWLVLRDSRGGVASKSYAITVVP
jgi:hypothetical protein